LQHYGKWLKPVTFPGAPTLARRTATQSGSAPAGPAGSVLHPALAAPHADRAAPPAADLARCWSRPGWPRPTEGDRGRPGQGWITARGQLPTPARRALARTTRDAVAEVTPRQPPRPGPRRLPSGHVDWLNRRTGAAALSQVARDCVSLLTGPLAPPSGNAPHPDCPSCSWTPRARSRRWCAAESVWQPAARAARTGPSRPPRGPA